MVFSEPDFQQADVSHLFLGSNSFAKMLSPLNSTFLESVYMHRLAVTSATVLIPRVDLADLTGWVAVSFLHHYSTQVPPRAVWQLEVDEGHFLWRDIYQLHTEKLLWPGLSVEKLIVDWKNNDLLLFGGWKWQVTRFLFFHVSYYTFSKGKEPLSQNLRHDRAAILRADSTFDMLSWGSSLPSQPLPSLY